MGMGMNDTHAFILIILFQKLNTMAYSSKSELPQLKNLLGTLFVSVQGTVK